MDLSRLAALLQDVGDDAELSNRIRSIINENEATDLLQHFYLDAVITGDCKTHTEYQLGQGKAPRKIEKQWYRAKEPIGHGTYGKVWLERDDQDVHGRPVKIMPKDSMKRAGIDYKKEILALAKFSKPRYQQQEVLVKFLGWSEDPSDLFLYMEFFELGDLESHITKPITEDKVKDISTNLLNGLCIIHNEGFTHRDLKPANIFVVQKPPAANWWVKIGDFGMSKRVRHELTALYTLVGTRPYMAPEVTGDLDTDEPTSIYDNMADIWSLGSTGVEFVKSLLVPSPQARLSAESAVKVPWLLRRQRDGVREKQEPAKSSTEIPLEVSHDVATPVTRGGVGSTTTLVEDTVGISTSRVPSDLTTPEAGSAADTDMSAAQAIADGSTVKFSGRSMSSGLSEYSSQDPLIDQPQEQQSKEIDTRIAASPEWYAEQLKDTTSRGQLFDDLVVCLESNPSSWAEAFVDAQGQVALANSLARVNWVNRPEVMTIPPRLYDANDHELSLVRCIGSLMRTQRGANNALKHNHIIGILAKSLFSRRLDTRGMTSGILAFLCEFGDGQGHRIILQVLKFRETRSSNLVRIDTWMKNFMAIMRTSRQLKDGGQHMETMFEEFCVSAMVLINAFVYGPKKPAERRLIRAELNNLGMTRILETLGALGYGAVDYQIARFLGNKPDVPKSLSQGQADESESALPTRSDFKTSKLTDLFSRDKFRKSRTSG